MKQSSLIAVALAPFLLVACDLVAPAQQRDRIDRVAIAPTTPVSPPQTPAL
jgi:hypothetical protein